MIFNLFKVVNFWAFGLASNIYPVPQDEVADRLESAIIELSKEEISKDILAIPPVATKHLIGFSDVERIRGIDVWMNRLEPKARIHGPGAIGRLLTNDPKMISDSSELRRMLMNEDDPGRFFLLSCFASYFTKRGETFIVEESRMLSRHGRVAPQTNQSNYSRVLGDVSAYTYESIVSTLTYLDASYNEATMLPHGGQIPYSEKIPILVKWLRDNWPGCEQLGDGEMLTVESALEHKQSGTSVVRPEKPFPVKENAEASSQPSANKLWWLVITGGVVLLASLAAWLKRKSKVPS